jgi:hypothetical protein
MKPAEGHISERAQRVYDYLLKVQKATREEIIDHADVARGEFHEIRNELVKQGYVNTLKGRRGGLILSSGSEATARTVPAEEESSGGLSKEAEILYQLIPDKGTHSNRELQTKLQINLKEKDVPIEEFAKRFWEYRQELLDQNLIKKERGRGGSVRKVEKHEPTRFVDDESKLYPELVKWLKLNDVAELRSKKWDAWVCDTSREHHPRESGKWSRPDVTVVKIKEYDFAPEKEFTVVGYEIKQHDDMDDTKGVFEAASHSKFCHECNLVIETSEEEANESQEPPEKLRSDLKRFGVGFGWLYRQKTGKDYFFVPLWDPIPRPPNPGDESQLLEVFCKTLPGEEQSAFKRAVKAR